MAPYMLLRPAARSRLRKGKKRAPGLDLSRRVCREDGILR
jgi:hypothetical protein